MRLDLGRFKNGTDRIDRRYEADAFGPPNPEHEFRIAGPVHLVAGVRKQGAQVNLTGRVKTSLELLCSRCLDPITVAVDAPFELLYLPVADTVTGPSGSPGQPDASKKAARRDKPGKAKTAAADDDDGDEVLDDDLGVSFYKGDEIDLGQLMREQFYLALPMKPLCVSECKGLCPVCGINRNRETCSCETKWVDPRFEVLKKLR